ncbi:BadF/BadG/BcrA/BcrD ATPase family protein [Caulobacter segnis]
MDKPNLSAGCFLGVDGGGTKTAFVLTDAEGPGAGPPRGRLQLPHPDRVRGAPHPAARRRSGGPRQGRRDARGRRLRLLRPARPWRGRASPTLPRRHPWRRCWATSACACGNDMICGGWAGSLGGEDGIQHRRGHWLDRPRRAPGPLGSGRRLGRGFSDEGSAYWIAVQGLNAFSRMADGRLPRGPLHEILTRELELASDLDICAYVYARVRAAARRIAALSRLVAHAAARGDAAAQRIFEEAGRELAAIVESIRVRLGYEPGETVDLSYSGGVFQGGELILKRLPSAIARLHS